MIRQFTVNIQCPYKVECPIQTRYRSTHSHTYTVLSTEELINFNQASSSCLCQIKSRVDQRPKTHALSSCTQSEEFRGDSVTTSCGSRQTIHKTCIYIVQPGWQATQTWDGRPTYDLATSELHRDGAVLHWHIIGRT